MVFWNAAAERLYGYQAAEMLGRDISVLVPADRPEELANIMGEVTQGRTVKALQTERLRKDGAIVPVSVTVSPVLGEDGTVIGASTIAHDLSQEHRTSKSPARSRETRGRGAEHPGDLAVKCPYRARVRRPGVPCRPHERGAGRDERVAGQRPDRQDCGGARAGDMASGRGRSTAMSWTTTRPSSISK